MKEIFTVLLALTGVLLLIWLTCRLAKWLNNRVYSGGDTSGTNGGSRLLKAVERLPLSNDKYLLVIKAGDKYLLIAVSPQHTELLCEIDREYAEKVSQNGGQNASGTDFLSVLKKTAAEKFRRPDGNGIPNSDEKDGNINEE